MCSVSVYASHSATGDPADSKESKSPDFPSMSPCCIFVGRGPSRPKQPSDTRPRTTWPCYLDVGRIGARGHVGRELYFSKQHVARKRRLMIYRSSPCNESMTHVSYRPGPGRDRRQLLQSRPACVMSLPLPRPITSRSWPLQLRKHGTSVASPAHAANDLPLRVPVLLALA